ncbi:patatin-like phospholipase family protein [Kordia sp. YSTF-M3]|uniref:Patatin-like phospholipase family protein n=1 Tax=Kordia aestuariivivens TaxID=2759037 RepID=A0ABR7Q7G2_9FLAO|nr:patatin-like phospholipase family protein [Kordia aestuariivivens]MBC8754512.1 patatin-like phospholipase family protein [Kordia aestuariivivens]
MDSSTKYQFSSFKYFERNNISKRIIIIFIILSALMMICGKMFSIYDWILHPQFTETSVTKAWFLDNTTTLQQWIFHLFFIFDFVWAALLFYILGRYVHTKATANSMQWVFKLFVVLASIAYTFDCTENFYYLFNKEYPQTIVSIKIGAYAIALITVLVVLLRYSLKNRFLILKEFVSSSWISLLFLVIIGLTLPKAPQVNSIIVDLYYKPFWFVIVLLLLLAPIYCITLSHYPNYFLLSKSNRKFKDKEWKMTKSFGIFGIVWYKNKKGNTKKSNEYESYISFLRRTIGVFFYAALFYMIAYTADTNFSIGVKLSGFSSVLVIALIWWLYVLKKKKDKWWLYYENSIKKADNEFDDLYIIKDDTSKPKSPMVSYIIFLTLTLVAHLLLFILLLWFEHPYNYTTVIISLVCVTLQAITYTYYRTYRTLFKYTFFNENNTAIFTAFPLLYDQTDTRSDELKKKEILTMFEKNNFFGQSSFFKMLSKIRIGSLSLGSLSNNVIFLQIIAYFGVANTLFLAAINIWPTFAMKVNAIIIILSYFFLLYGIIVIILKHFIYYNLAEDDFAQRNKKKFFFTVYTTVLLLVIFSYLARSNESSANNLFELAQIEDTTQKKVTLQEYTKNLPNTRYYIGCYGGGMKANAWTMTVLNALDKNNTLYDKTVCMSGASGGTIGLINYSVIKHEISDLEKRNAAIKRIGTENILSMDLAHLFGRDWFTHVFLPINLQGKDRSTGAMRTYAEYANPTFNEAAFQSKTYRQYWNEMYAKRENRFPILISNSTNIKGRQGMAVSVPTEGISHQILYLGANDILALDNDKTLSFYNAASTTNRFPLISPAATIEGEGQYNDGGIYENSGLLSAYKLYEAINELDPSAEQKKTVFINIINDKAQYVKSRMDSIMGICKGGRINKSNEISAIVNSVAATEMFPGYIKDKLKLLTIQNDSVTFESLYLPHKFDFDDIQAIYGMDVKNTACVKTIAEMIETNNTEIKNLMEGCSKETNTIIEPEMSRVMAVPAFDFMQYMLNHSSIKSTIEKLQ